MRFRLIRLVILRQPALVSLDHIIAQRHDIVNGQFALHMRIHQRSLINVFLLQGLGGLDGQQLFVDIGTVQRRALLRQIAT